MPKNEKITWRALRTRALEQLDRAHVDDAPGKLRWLIAFLLHQKSLSRADALLDACPTPHQTAAFHQYLARLLTHEPVQYVIGETDFMGMTFRCTPAALIPRPETELLALSAIDWLRHHPSQNPHIIDVGTGTGCLACTIKTAFPSAHVTATDLSPDALALARLNATRLHLTIAFRQNNLLDSFPPDSATLILANLPYVPSQQLLTLPKTIRHFEPHLALDGGPDGLRLISRLAHQAASVLLSNGALLLEIGDGQSNQVLSCLTQTHRFPHPIPQCDYAGHSRLILATRRP